MRYRFCVVLLALCLCHAAELYASVIYVNRNATGSGKGSSWANAHTELRPALAAAVAKDEIWVAAGTYTPGKNRTDTFLLKPDVAIYGGFNGTEPARDQRNRTANLTVLSGDLLGNDSGFANNTENVYHVVTGADNATIDGFVITGGNANGTGANAFGGGMYNLSASPTIQHCFFFGNSAGEGGGGGGMCNSAASPRIVRCTFAGNRGGYGGAVRNHDSSSPEIRDCLFSGNSATWCAAGIYNNHSTPAVESCTFCGNSGANVAGAAMYNGFSSPVVRNCLFVGNSSVIGFGGTGGAMWNHYASSPSIENCTFFGNACFSFGGAVYGSGGSTPVMRNCIIWGCSSKFRAKGLFQYGGTASVFYSDMQGGFSDIAALTFDEKEVINGGGNIDADPLFVGGPTGTWTQNAAYDAKTFQSTLTDAKATWEPDRLKGKFIQPDTGSTLQYAIVGNGANSLTIWGNVCAAALNGKAYRVNDCHLREGSPCIDAGANLADVTSDLDGTPRSTDGNNDGKAAIDIGAYEFVSPKAAGQ
jgi:hypothetical protein